MTDTTNQAQRDAAAEDPSVDPTNQVLNPEPGQGARDFQGFATKDGEVIEQDGNPLNTSTEKPAAKAAAKPAAKKEDTAHRDPQKRIDQSVAKQRAAERRADLAEAKLASFEARMAALEAGRTQPALDAAKTATTSEAVAPDPAKYQYGEADARYIRDLSRHETLKAIAESNRSSQATAQQQAAAKAAQDKKAAIDAWADKAPVDKYEDFQEVVVDAAMRNEWPLSETLGALIQDSPVGYDIAYALASDLKEAVRISKLSAAKQAAWFGVEEARLTDEDGATQRNGSGGSARQQNPVRVSQAPAVPKHQARGAGGGEPVNASTTNFADFEKLARQR